LGGSFGSKGRSITLVFGNIGSVMQGGGG
jgi:hypothetical protein